MTISVIVPVHGGIKNLKLCLEALQASDVPFLEIIVVSDGNSRGALFFVEQQYGARVIEIPSPAKGPAFARNEGAAAARGDILLFVDADVVLPPGAARIILEAFQHEPDIAALFGSYDDQPAEQNFLSQYKNLFNHFVHQTADEQTHIFWAGCGALRRDVFRDIGGFDIRYRRPTVEDIEMGQRLKKKGHKIRLVKALQVKHLKRWSAAGLIRSDFFNRALPWSTLILEDGDLINDLNLKVSQRLSAVLCVLLLVSLFTIKATASAVYLVGALGISLVLINWKLYHFFVSKRGVVFTLKVVFWHWLYYLYSTLAFGIAWCKHTLKRTFRRP